VLHIKGPGYGFFGKNKEIKQCNIQHLNYLITK
jgi:hypothetical protein